MQRITWSNSRGGGGVATGTNTWSIPNVTLASGSNVITVTAEDANGNRATDSLTVTATFPDTTPPAVAITGPTTDSEFMWQSATITMTGTAADNRGVTGVQWANSRNTGGAATGTTAWSATDIPLAEGPNPITLTARDAAGNAGTKTVTVVYVPPDAVLPAITINFPTINAVYGTTVNKINLSGIASDNQGMTEVRWANNRGGQGVAAGLLVWSVNDIPLQSGLNVITVTTTDAAGNTQSDTLSVTCTMSPAVTTLVASGVIFNAATLNGTVNPNGLVTTVHFEYGLTTAYGTSTPNQTLAAGASAVSIQAAVGLTPDTVYHYRLVGTNALGTRYGADRVLTTPNNGVVGAWVERTVVRNLPTMVGSAVEVGAFTFTGSSGSMEIALNVSDGEGRWSVAKRYLGLMRSNLSGISPANTWLGVLPTHDSGAFSGNDCDLEIKVNNGTAYLRVRTKAYSTGTPVATIAIKTTGLRSFVNSTATAAVAAPTVTLGTNSVTEIAGKTGIGVAPVDSAALDIDGGATRGLRLRPRTVSGAPTSGTWNQGTIILDAAGNLYICTAAGSPGTWKKVGP